MKAMSENERLLLIVEAVKYCQKVRSLGMPKTSYTKALREPVFFLWECYGKKKVQAARYRSEYSLKTASEPNAHVYDHAIPFRIVQESLLSIATPEPGAVRDVLQNQVVSCLITKDEDKLLTSLGLRSSMPANSEALDHLARYASAGIRVIPNPAYVPHQS